VRQVAKKFDEIEYTLEIKDMRQTYLFWNSKLKGRLLEAVTIVSLWRGQGPCFIHGYHGIGLLGIMSWL